jgi:hypothetical protein
MGSKWWLMTPSTSIAGYRFRSPEDGGGEAHDAVEVLRGHHSTEARRESPSRVVFSSCTRATRM